MALNAAVQVRFEPEIERRLNEASERLGLAKADLIRRATERLLDEVERTQKLTFEFRQTDRRYPGPTASNQATVVADADPIEAEANRIVEETRAEVEEELRQAKAQAGSRRRRVRTT